MRKLTARQLTLLSYIDRYRRKHGRTPDLKEMVAHLGVFDNRSLLKMIDSLIKKDYLEREGRKTRTIKLSGKGHKLLNQVPVEYERLIRDYRLKMLTELERNGASAFLSTSDALSYKKNRLRVNGTNKKMDIGDVVASVANLAIRRYCNGTQLIQVYGRDQEDQVADRIGRLVGGIFGWVYLRWCLAFLFLLWIANIFFHENYMALFYVTWCSVLFKFLRNPNEFRS